MGAQTIKRAVHWGGSGLACVALVYFILKFWEQIEGAIPLVLADGNWILLCMLAACVSLQMACAAFAWRSILACMKVDLSRRLATRIVYISQIARYLPGNVGHYVGKLVLLRMQGVGLKLGAASVFLETIGVLLFGLLISFVFLPSASVRFLLEYQSFWWIAIIGMCVVLCVGFILFRKHRARIIGQLMEYLSSMDMEKQWWRVLEITVCYLSNFFFLGALAWVIGSRIFGASSVGVLELTGIMSLAWTVGFLAPGAPAGLGVREVICLVLLSSSYSEETTLGIIVLHRLVLTAGDLLTFLIGLMIKPARASLGDENTLHGS